MTVLFIEKTSDHFPFLSFGVLHYVGKDLEELMLKLDIKQCRLLIWLPD